MITNYIKIQLSLALIVFMPMWILQDIVNGFRVNSTYNHMMLWYFIKLLTSYTAERKQKTYLYFCNYIVAIFLDWVTSF